MNTAVNSNCCFPEISGREPRDRLPVSVTVHPNRREASLQHEQRISHMLRLRARRWPLDRIARSDPSTSYRILCPLNDCRLTLQCNCCMPTTALYAKAMMIFMMRWADIAAKNISFASPSYSAERVSLAPSVRAKWVLQPPSQ
jgi:hypothetical protein